MIDTDKYEGHDYNWYLEHYEDTGKHEVRAFVDVEVLGDMRLGHVCYLDYHPCSKDKQARNAELIADAPLLLAEVKRLREGIKTYCEHRPYNERQVRRAFRKLRELIE